MTPPITPERQKRVARSLKVYSILAWITGVFLILVCVEMILKYLVIGVDNAPEWFLLILQLHGLAFLLYAVSCLDLGTKARWAPQKWLSTLLGGVVPFLSFYMERKRREEVTHTFQLK